MMLPPPIVICTHAEPDRHPYGWRRGLDVDDTSVLGLMRAKIRGMLTFLQDMQSEDELRSVPSWKAHLLTGNRKGTWCLPVTRNWRLTCRIGGDETEIIDLDYEDYH